MLPDPAITLATVLCVLVLPALAVWLLEWGIKGRENNPR